MNLDGIRERSHQCEKARAVANGDISPNWSLAAIASAADVPALLDYIASLRAALGEERAAHAQTLNRLCTHFHGDVEMVSCYSGGGHPWTTACAIAACAACAEGSTPVDSEAGRA